MDALQQLQALVRLALELGEKVTVDTTFEDGRTVRVTMTGLDKREIEERGKVRPN